MAFPTTVLPVTVELALGADLTANPATWTWTNVTAYCYLRDNGIQIQRGRADEFTQTAPSVVTFTANNRDGRWSPRNPTGAWYGQLRLNTPVRVTVSEGAASRRALAFISELPPRWDPSGNDMHVPVRADGFLRRLQQQTSPPQSALRRAFLATSPGAYWPGEDEAGATHLAQAAGPEVMRYAGTLSVGAEGPAGSASAVELSTDSQMHAVVAAPTVVGAWTVAQVVNVPVAVASSTVLYAWSTSEYTSSLVWLLTLAPGTPDTLTLTATTTAGAVVINDSMSFTAGTISEPYGRDLLVAVTVVQDNFDLDYEATVRVGGQSSSNTGTLAATTLGQLTTVAMYPSANLDGATVGHFAAWGRALTSTELDDIAALLAGGDGESATDRATRLGAESGIIISADLGTGTYDDAVRAMGPQPIASLVDGLREAEAVDGGILVELREPDGAGALLTLRSAVGLHGRDVDLTLDNDASDLGLPFEPAGNDDQGVVNTFTATRTGGSSHTATDDDHIALYGTYDNGSTFNVSGDAQLPDLATWQVHLGTVDEQRYPLVVVWLHASPALIADWVTCDIGSRIQITNPPAGLPPDTIDLMVQGYTETISSKAWTIEMNCAPYAPWVAWTLEDTTLGRLHPDSCVLAEALDTTETGVDVTTSPLWTTSLGGSFDIWVGGERMTVTAISGTGNPQTLTVTRSINGVVKAHALGAEVRLWSPHVLAR